jgi:hypothetical protein
MKAVMHPAAAEWLARFDHAAAALPQPRRGELRQELVDHLDALLAEEMTDDELTTAVSRLGDPADIVATEGLPPVSPGRARAGLGLLLLPFTALPYMTPALPPGLLSVSLIVLASLVVLALVLQAEGPRTLGVLGALAPSLVMIGAGLDKVFQAGYLLVDQPIGPGQYVHWVTDSLVATLGQLALLVLGLGLPVAAGLHMRRLNTPIDIGVLALLLTPVVGLATALLLSGSRLDAHAGTFLETPLLVIALMCGAALLAAGGLLLTRPGFGLPTKILVAAAVLAAPVGVTLLAQHDTQFNGTPVGVEAEQLPITSPDVPDFALAPAPAWVPADRNVRRGLGLLFVVALPAAAAWRTGRRHIYSLSSRPYQR